MTGGRTIGGRFGMSEERAQAKWYSPGESVSATLSCIGRPSTTGAKKPTDDADAHDRERDEPAGRRSPERHDPGKARHRHRPRLASRLDLAGSDPFHFRQALRGSLPGWQLLAA